MAMQYPSTLGIALLILVAVTTAVGPSAANGNQRFKSIYQTLNTIRPLAH